jgi:nucleoside-diphosphate-sugar epimerase
MTRTLVTGGAGYVGSVVVDELLASGRSVRVLDVLAHGSVPSLLLPWGRAQFEFLKGDVRDEEIVGRALQEVDEIVHLAAVVGDPACAREPELANEVNVDATLRLLESAEAAGVSRLVFASTCSNYGKMTDSDQLATEEWDLRPVSLYAETKVHAERAVLQHATPGFATTCLRFATVYGTSPRMRFDLTVNEFTRDLWANRKLDVFGELFWRPYIHVHDAGRAVALVLASPAEKVSGEVFNGGHSDENYRKLDLVELITRRLGRGEVDYVHRDEDPRDYKVSFEKIRAELGFEPVHRVPDGVDELVEALEDRRFGDPFDGRYSNI